MNGLRTALIFLGTFGFLMAASAVGLASFDAAHAGEARMASTAHVGTARTPGEVRYSKSGHDITRLDRAEVERLAENLNDEQRRVLLNAGTEAPFCGTLLDNKKEGMYACALCQLPLFSSEHKFTSGTGWPSYFQPIDPDHVDEHEDTSYGMVRTEIRCARCDGHLGHVFPDGPKPTGQRYCLNSAAMTFFEAGDELPEAARPVQTEVAYFAGGCFWGVEDFFEKQPGVIDAVSGYQGGHVEEPTYKEVCTGSTGHAESVRVVYDPARTSYEEMLWTFFRIHDPTQLNRQGWDVGTQYRSAIFVVNDEQRAKAEAFIAEQAQRDRFKGRKIVTEINEFAPFYVAEAYHQDYNARTGRQCHAPYE